MKSARILALAALLLGAAFLPSCGSGGSSVSGQGHLDVYLTDAPPCLPDVQSVVVSITGVWIFPGLDDMDGDMDPNTPSGMDDVDPNNDVDTEGPPIPIMDYPAEFDLLSLMNGVTTILGSTDLPAGWYHKIRLELSQAVLTFTDGSMVDLKIDSHKVDILARIQVHEDGTTAVTLDFDACQSVKITTTGDSDKYILRPVVNALNIP